MIKKAKHKNIFCLFFMFLFSLVSCVSRRINIIVPGRYVGVVSQNENISCKLFITRLSETEYIQQNGKNVIRDGINNEYYLLEFTLCYEENNMQRIDFFNFRDAYKGAAGTPISYVDDNNCWFTPISARNNYILPSSECCCSVSANVDGFEFYSYLFCDED